MIVTDKFVFVHFPRTGGTFITDVITRFFPSAQEIGYHLPRSLLPNEYSHLPVLGSVRNPWEFYVSWYYHVWPRDAATPLHSWLSENGKHQFEGATRNALNLGTDNDRLDDLIEKLPDEVDYRKRNIANITKDALRKIRGTGVGYYTFRFNHLFGDADEVFFCRQESLRVDLINFLEQVSAANDQIRTHILESEKKNTAEHKHYSSYYTSELAELVSIRDRSVIERFGYVFQQSSSLVNQALDPSLKNSYELKSKCPETREIRTVRESEQTTSRDKVGGPMGIVPIYVWNHLPSADNKDGLVARSEQPVLPEVIEERKILFRRLQDEDAYFLERIVRLCRIFKAVYCPSTARHIESANLICELLKLPTPIPDARLNNVDYGKFKGQPSSVMKPRHEYVEKPYSGGDSWLDCLRHWRLFFEDILPQYDGQPVLLAGQTGAAIRMCAHLCEGMKLSDAVDLEFSDPKVSWVYFYKF